MPIIIDACFVLDLLWTFNASNLHCRDKIIGFHSLIFYLIPLCQWDLKKPPPVIKNLATGHAKELTGLERYSYS